MRESLNDLHAVTAHTIHYDESHIGVNTFHYKLTIMTCRKVSLLSSRLLLYWKRCATLAPPTPIIFAASGLIVGLPRPSPDILFFQVIRLLPDDITMHHAAPSYFQVPYAMEESQTTASCVCVSVRVNEGETVGS